MQVVPRKKPISRQELLDRLGNPSHRAFALTMKQVVDDGIIRRIRDEKDRRRMSYVRLKSHALELERACMVLGILEFWHFTANRYWRMRLYKSEKIGAVQLRRSIASEVEYGISLRSNRLVNRILRECFLKTRQRIHRTEKISLADAELRLHTEVFRLIGRESRWVQSVLMDIVERACHDAVREVGKLNMLDITEMRDATKALVEGRVPELGKEPPYF